MRIVWLAFLAAAPLFAQLDNDTITITATEAPRTASPDQVRISVSISADLGKGFDEVLAAVPGLGLSARDLTGVNPAPVFCATGSGCGNGPLQWEFSFTAPLANLKQTLAKLGSAPATGPVAVAYSVNADFSGPSSSDCPFAGLIALARRQAQTVAGASGLRVGGIVTLADAPASRPATVFAAFRFGDFSTSVPAVFDPLTSSGTVFFNPPPLPAPGCSAVVQFRLLR